ncbi:hypothetical protein J41TS12_05980 [Paenibacillus antibioticophila]|uniref:Uncharacterized protein n=1 Tax=Paenibacillus antibioticophila TaxID=1274374 RepID=A0A919XS81_9BACL|nr:hypothetical protein [Paenibacillus antibioticophila]GIO35737.1 hypothetical protein J41TS12_05980 [Paenibacillus antibioticophila]
MGLSVYRIDTGLIGRIFGFFRKTDLPTPVGVAAATSLTKRIGLSISDLMNFENHYVINSEGELKRFENPLGNSWSKSAGQYYIRHPKKSRERQLIEAEKFHEYIYREQISDIVAFLRANLSIKHLTISSTAETDFSAFANLPIEDLKIEGKAEVKLFSKKELVINCPEGLKISEKRKEYVWIKDFQELLAVVDGFPGGDFHHSIEISNSFGMTLKEAKLLGIEGSWLNKRKFEIKFSC